MTTICLLIGLPAAGKSTFLGQLIESYRTDVDPPHICSIEYDRLLPANLDLRSREPTPGRDTSPDEETLQVYTLPRNEQHDSQEPHRLPEPIELPKSDESCDTHKLRDQYTKESQETWKTYRERVFLFVKSVVQRVSEGGDNDCNNISQLIPTRNNSERLNATTDSYTDSFETSNTMTHHEMMVRSNLCSCVTAPPCSAPTTRHRHVIFVDDNMFYRSMRVPFHRLARDSNCGFGQLHLHCDRAKLMTRNYLREAPVSDETIARMFGLFEVPDVEANGWEARSMTIRSDAPVEEMTVRKVKKFVEGCLRHPVVVDSKQQVSDEQRDADRCACAANSAHQLDGAARKRVTEVLNAARLGGASGAQLKVIALRYNDARKRLLEVWRRGVLIDGLEEGVEALLERFVECK